jgi:glutamine amidotransferase-like protein
MKVAACFQSDNADCLSAVGKMSAAQRLLEGQETQCREVSGGAIGWVTGAERHSRAPFLMERDGNVLVVTGTPIDMEGSLADRLSHVVGEDYQRASEQLSELDGPFAAIFWESHSAKLIVVTDPLGLQPLYMRHDAKGLLLATELKAFSPGGAVPLEMDPAGWGAFIALGYMVGNDTLLEGVKRVDPGSVTTYCPASNSLDTRAYWNWPGLSSSASLGDTDTQGLVDSLRREAQAYEQHAPGGTVLLSGGFDSRITLAVLDEQGADPNALILAHKDEWGGVDGRCAVAAARSIGAPYRIEEGSRSFYSSKSYVDYLVMNEVMTPSLYLFIAQVADHFDPAMRVVWDGSPPGYGFVPAFLPPGGFDVFRKHVFRERDDLQWRAAEEIFGKDRADGMFEACNAAFARETARYEDNESGVTRYEVMNRMRSRTAGNTLKVYPNYAMTFLPAVSRAFWDIAGAIPYSVTRAFNMYFAVYREHFPQVAQVPFLSGGVLMDQHARGMSARLIAARYRMARSGPGRRLMKLARRITRGSWMYWEESRYLDAARRRANLDHPDLSVDAVRALQRQEAPYDWATQLKRNLLFYWQMWRWILSGELTTHNSQSFFEREEG